jgi:cytoskeletal protein RodZ
MNPHAGQELKAVRESKGLSVEQAARDVCLRADLLRELEDDSEDRSLPDIYRKLSLRMYARYLGVAFTATRDGHSTVLSPVDGCVELAYSENMRDETEPKKRRVVGPGTILAASAVLVLTTGLWSLNAKISRLNFEERETPAALTLAETAPAGANNVRLDDALFLELAAPAAAAPEQ